MMRGWAALAVGTLLVLLTCGVVCCTLVCFYGAQASILWNLFSLFHAPWLAVV